MYQLEVLLYNEFLSKSICTIVYVATFEQCYMQETITKLKELFSIISDVGHGLMMLFAENRMAYQKFHHLLLLSIQRLSDTSQVETHLLCMTVACLEITLHHHSYRCAILSCAAS